MGQYDNLYSQQNVVDGRRRGRVRLECGRGGVTAVGVRGRAIAWGAQGMTYDTDGCLLSVTLVFM